MDEMIDEDDGEHIDDTDYSDDVASTAATSSVLEGHGGQLHDDR